MAPSLAEDGFESQNWEGRRKWWGRPDISGQWGPYQRGGRPKNHRTSICNFVKADLGGLNPMIDPRLETQKKK